MCWKHCRGKLVWFASSRSPMSLCFGALCVSVGYAQASQDPEGKGWCITIN